MKRLLPLIVLVTLLGCAETRWQQSQPTQKDPPFGGGFASSNRPGGGDDPMDQNLRRTDFRPVWRGDNGAPETRVNPNTGGMSGPDARIDRRTQ